MTNISERQRARLYIYTKQKNAKFIYIYSKIQTLRKKQDNLQYVFIYKKIDTLRHAIFHENSDMVIFIQKHDTLRYVTFLYTKSLTLRKKQDNLCYVFLYTKILTLCVTRFFMEFLKMAEGGRVIHKKQWNLRYIRISKKQCIFRYVFIYKNPDTLRHFFIGKKQCTLCYIYIYNLSYSIYLYLTINARMIRAIRSINKFELFIENSSYSCDK